VLHTSSPSDSPPEPASPTSEPPDAVEPLTPPLAEPAEAAPPELEPAEPWPPLLPSVPAIPLFEPALAAFDVALPLPPQATNPKVTRHASMCAPLLIPKARPIKTMGTESIRTEWGYKYLLDLASFSQCGRCVRREASV
jgi:hypothetical protein